MFSRRDLQELAELKSTHGPILSLYLNVDPTQHAREEYKLALRGLLRDAGTMGAAPEDIAAVERFFDFEYDWSGRGVAAFSCAADNFWRTYSLAVPLRHHVFVWDKPYVKPLAQMWDAYGRFVAAIVDRQGAKLLLYQMGELAVKDGIMGDKVRRVKAGGGSTETGLRGEGAAANKHEDEVAARNLKEAAAMTLAFCEAHRPRNLLLGGKAEVLKQFQARLPRVWADRVIGTFAADMGMGENEIRDKALKVLQKVEEEREVALADAVITAAAKGRGGVLTLDDTLSAAHDGRVQALVVDQDYHAEGFQCQGCGYVTGQNMQACPFCGGAMAPIPDAIETIIAQVLEQGGRVEIVAGHKKLARAGIGALLRY